MRQHYCRACEKRVLSPYFKRVAKYNLDAWAGVLGVKLQVRDNLCSLHFSSKEATSPSKAGLDGGYWAASPSSTSRLQLHNKRKALEIDAQHKQEHDKRVTSLLEYDNYQKDTLAAKHKQQTINQQHKTITRQSKLIKIQQKQLDTGVSERHVTAFETKLLRTSNKHLNSKVKELQATVNRLRKQLGERDKRIYQEIKPIFSLHTFKDNPKSMRHWTAFEDYNQFRSFFDSLDAAKGINCILLITFAGDPCGAHCG